MRYPVKFILLFPLYHCYLLHGGFECFWSQFYIVLAYFSTDYQIFSCQNLATKYTLKISLPKPCQKFLQEFSVGLIYHKSG